MIWRWSLAFLILALSVAYAEGPPQQRTESTDVTKFEFPANGTIRWNASYGDLYIEGWDAPRVEIAVTRSTEYGEADAAKLGTVQVKSVRKSDNEIAISTVQPKGNHVRMEYRVSLPRDTQLVIDHRGGMILVGNVTGDVEISNRDGDILLMLPAGGAYAIDACVKMGHIASDFPGSTGNRYLVGQSFRSTPAGSARKLHLRTGFGGITIQALAHEAEGLSGRLPE